MEYIILDLEWDSEFFKPEKRFINHILQIGAIKLDEEFNVIDTFSVNIRSEISNRVSGHFAKLTGISSDDMRHGIPFCDAVEKYNLFSKGASVTMTWSDSDLHTIIENEEHILCGKAKFNFNGYLDLQKFVQNHLYSKGYEDKNQISVENAAELLGFNTDGYELHTALDDCRVCALMLKQCYNEKLFNSMIRDTNTPDFYARLKFKPYAISDIHDENIEKSQLKFNCPECGGKTERIKAWKYRNRWFMSDFKCKNCGFMFNGRVMFKKTFDNVTVKRRVCEFKVKGKKTDDMQSVSEKV